MSKLRDWAHALKRETLVLYFALRDPRTPWFAKLVAGMIVAYALSPIDLIPDFIPVLGLLDELILLPLALWLALRLVPRAALADARVLAEQASSRPVNRGAAAAIVAIWVLLAAACALWIWNRLK